MSALKINKLILILIGIMFLNNQGLSQDIKPPVAKKIPKELKIHNQIRTDNYYWLNQREDPEVISYLNAENEYTEKVLKKTEPLQEKLYNEMISRIKQNDESVPYKRNGYFYYTRFEEGKDYPIYCRKKDNLNSSEEIMLNVNEMAKDYAYYNVSGLTVSPDNKLLAFGVDNVSRRIYTIYVKNLETGKILSDSIKSTSSNSVFAADNKTLFYSVIDSTLRSDKIYRHILGDNQEKDKLVYDEPDATFNVFVYKTRSKDYIVIGSSSTLTNDFRILKANDPLGEFKEFSPRKKGVEYQVDHFNNKFYIVTNYEAQNFRLMTSDANKTSIENWKELIPHRKDVLLEGIELFDKFLVIQERKNGLTNIRIKSWDGEFEHNLDFGEPAYLAYIEMNPEPNTEILRYGYTSLTTPNSVIDYNMVTREKTIMKEDEILGGFNKANYTSERIYVKAEDGTMIPVSMVYRKDLDTTKTNPLLLYGYGSYGISTDPTFSSVRLSLLDRGFIYAIAHIRGGQELGRGWYDDGKLLKKMNTFTDFIDCAKYLIDKKYTDKEKLFALGGSAGGLLMGAVVNMAPELFKGVVAAVPFVDVVTTMLDESIPLTTGEYDEWGNPNDEQYYNYILKYSPYDNVKEVEYPNLLVTTGLHDSQVQYWEPAKWVAKLRTMKKGNNLLLLKTNMEAGHGGASGRFKRLKETALDYAFFLSLLNINQ